MTDASASNPQMDGAALSLPGRIDQGEILFLVDKNADGIVVVDEYGAVLFANPAAEHIFARPAAQLVGTQLGLPLVAGEISEITVRQADGTLVEVEIRTVDTTWDHRRARLVSLRDISARRALEERLRHSAKMEAVGRLTAGIAHDFNNLLTVVLGNIEHAQRRISDPALLRSLDNAMRGARGAAKLTERLLAFARRTPLEPRRVNVNALVAGMSDLLVRTLGERIEVRPQFATDVADIEVDPTELESAILNLAVNARDAMPDGGRLTIETSNVVLDAAAAAAAEAGPGSYVLISVSDTGFGIEPDMVQQVFEPFFTTKLDGRGTGLGLSQVYGFARQSGGSVTLHSAPGAGTTVSLYLPQVWHPVEPADVPAAEAPPLEAVARGRPDEVVLLVEDDPDVRSYGVGSLRELGYSVFEAATAAEALAILDRERSISLLFTDLGLPGGLNGKQLADRAQALRPDLRILITTAYAGGALVHDGRLDRQIALLSKPFTLSALATRLRQLLDGPCAGPYS